MVVYFLSVAGIFSINLIFYFINPYFKENLYFTDFMIGIAMALLQLCRGITSRYIGAVLNPKNCLKYFSLFFLMLSITGILYSLQIGYFSFFVRILQGFSTAIFWVTSLTLISYLTPHGEKVHGLCKYSVFIGLASILSAFIGGILIDIYTPIFSFRVSAFLSFLMFLFICILINREKNFNFEFEDDGNVKKKGKFGFKDLNKYQKISIGSIVVINTINNFVHSYGGIAIRNEYGTYKMIGYMICSYLALNLLLNILSPYIIKTINPLILLFTLYSSATILSLIIFFYHQLFVLLITIPLLVGVATLLKISWNSFMQENTSQLEQGSIIGYSSSTKDFISIIYSIIFALISRGLGIYWITIFISFTMFINIFFVYANREILK